MAETKETSAPATKAYNKHLQDAIAPDSEGGKKSMPWSIRLLIFVLFPTLVGLLGLYMGYLESLRKEDRELNVDTDFVMPFLLALAFAVVIAFQTRGFQSREVEPLVKWPKVRRKKVIRKVRKEDLDENDEITGKGSAGKKDD
jgi:hypothetical protein